MGRSKPKNQHYVPACYLREWVDAHTPAGQEPYVWIFEKGARKGKRKAPSNIFTETDLYTLHLKSGEKDYVIEEALSALESRYAGLFRSKIAKHQPLSAEEHMILCAFVGVMLQRTLRHRDMLARFFDQLIERVEDMEKAHIARPMESDSLESAKRDAHKLTMLTSLPHLTSLLRQMSIAFLCASGGARFVTSDDPCNLFNPDLQWQRPIGPGLAQKNIQVTLPLSPNIMLCMSWSALRGYIAWERSRVHEANRMVVGHSYSYFVSDSPGTRRHWYRRYPLNILFLLKVFSHKARAAWSRARSLLHNYYVRKR
jgi:hypothetical protein